MKKNISLKKLIEYCEKNEINVLKGAKREYYINAIIRHELNDKDFFSKDCFGWWENDNSECIYCDHEDKCFELSIGMKKEEYMKKIKGEYE